jgi:Cu/Ag efflux protein CusF
LAARRAAGDGRSFARRRTLLVGAILVAVFVDAQAQTRFEGEGRIVAVDEAKGPVTLDHGPVAGLMPAVRMEFPVDPAELLRGVRVGDVVRFTLQARGPGWVVASMARAARGGIAQAASLPAPDFTLPTLAAGSVRLSDLRGKVVLLNFWATWCVPARVKPAMGDHAWALWSVEWTPAAPGTATIVVRAVDGTGAVQPAGPEPPLPDGAEGWHALPVRVA